MADRCGASAHRRVAEVERALGAERGIAVRLVDPQLLAAAAKEPARIVRGLQGHRFREGACSEALSQGVHSSSVILNILARQKDPGPAVTVTTPDALRLQHAPAADCARYDSLRKGIPWKEPTFSA